MVQNETNLKVADNSGAKSVRVFRLLGGSVRKSASIGDIVICAVKDALPSGTVKKGEVVKGIIVRTKKEIIRANGNNIKFDDNAIVLIKKDGTPVGTRVFGPVAREIRDLGETGMKIASLAVEVL